MKRFANLPLLSLGIAAVFAILSGQGDAGPGTRGAGATGEAPASSEVAERLAQSSPDTELTQREGAANPRNTRNTRGLNHPPQFRLDRPAQAIGRELTPEMIDLCMEVAFDIDERLAKKLAVLRTRDVKQFEAKLRRSRRLTAMAELKKQSPSLYTLKLHELKVDAAVSRLAGEAHRALAGLDSEADALEDELGVQATLQLAFRYRAREDYLCRLREHVERLERELKEEREDLKNNFDRVLEERMAELLRDPAAAPKSDTGLPGHLPTLDQASLIAVPE